MKSIEENFPVKDRNIFTHKKCYNNSTLERVLENNPVLKNLVLKYENYTIEEYIRDIKHVKSEEIESSADVGKVIRDYIGPILGSDVANRSADVILKYRMFFTANHHQPEFYAQALQSNLISYKWYDIQGSNFNNVPVFTGSAVSMGNGNYPRGMQIYDSILEDRSLKISLYPEPKMSGSIVYTIKAFNKDMVKRAIKILDKKYRDEFIDTKIYETGKNIFEKYYLSDEVLSLSNYANQAIALNYNIGKAIIVDTKPEFVYISLEEISKRLLIIDLHKNCSFVENILFDNSIRNLLIEKLNGVNGCWTNETFAGLFDESQKGRIFKVKGTHFFWGIDEQGIRYPLMLKKKDNEYILVGITEKGIYHEFLFDKLNIIRLLEDNVIIPGVFLIFVQVCFCRDFTMNGGYFQGVYLEKMKKGIIDALNQNNKYPEYVKSLEKKECKYCYSGPIIYVKNKNKKLIVCSTVELLSDNGITKNKLDELLKINFKDAVDYGLRNLVRIDRMISGK